MCIIQKSFVAAAVSGLGPGGPVTSSSCSGNSPGRIRSRSSSPSSDSCGFATYESDISYQTAPQLP